MISDENPTIGQVLLAVGGGLFIGKIISELLDDGSTRETRSSSSRKRSSTKNLSGSKRSKKFVVEIPDPRQINEVSRSVTPSLEDRKYPDNYYSLSKAQQYKYRQRMSKELFEISQKQ